MVEIYILDDQLRREEIVEKFESFIWTERYNSFGDFELIIDPRIAESQLGVPGRMLSIDQSDRVMIIDTITTTTTDEGIKALKVTGKSLEYLLEHRVNQTGFYAGGPVAEISRTGTPGNIIRALFHDICRTNAGSSNENIPFVQAGTISSFVGAIAEPATSITYKRGFDTLYKTIKELADIYDLGFRLIRVADEPKLYFEVYTGFDRTSAQAVRDPIIFSPELDNLTNTSELNSNGLEKTVAYVVYNGGTHVVYADGYDSLNAGLDRKALIVDATDLTGTPSTAVLEIRGKQELASRKYIIGFDGEIPSSPKYIYNTHYKLGDLVEQQSETGVKRVLRVTEQIITSDKEGERSYPTLTFNGTLITPGTWYAIPGSQEWYDYISTVYWNSM